MESCEELDDDEVEETPAIIYKIGMVIKCFESTKYHFIDRAVPVKIIWENT